MYLSLMLCMAWAEVVRHASQIADSAYLFVLESKTQCKKGYTESAFSDACHTSPAK